jgi:hypothetical protein
VRVGAASGSGAPEPTPARNATEENES